jgi:hypothetical protein
VTFGVNEVVEDSETRTSFFPKASAAFREAVLAIWGPGGCRSTTRRVTKCNACGEQIGACDCSRERREEAGTAVMFADRVDEAMEFDGKMIPLGRRPHTTRSPW